MIEQRKSEKPLRGKTYSLYSGSQDTSGYYSRIAELAEECLCRWPDGPELIHQIRYAWKKRRSLKHPEQWYGAQSPIRHILTVMQQDFHPYTATLREHLCSLPLRKRLDRTISMTEPQYHLAMLEIELVNRFFRPAFLSAGTKMAFLPHCLRDFARECRSTPGEHDYVCRGCSRSCSVNMTRKVLVRHGVQPYIWMTANLGALLKKLRDRGNHPGVLGVACVPELVRGMRMVSRLGIPVVGIPLDANRCARWTGTFKDNTVNWQELENLVTPS